MCLVGGVIVLNVGSADTARTRRTNRGVTDVLRVHHPADVSSLG